MGKVVPLRLPVSGYLHSIERLWHPEQGWPPLHFLRPVAQERQARDPLSNELRLGSA